MNKKTFEFAKAPLCALALGSALSFGAVSAAYAHGGEDHGDEAAAVPAGQVLAPRTEASSEDVEMLAVYESRALTLYLSDFKTNAPLAGAEVEIEGGGGKAIAKAVAEGVYKAETPWIAEPGKHPLVVTIQGAEVADLLEASLEIPKPQEAQTERALTRLTPTAMAGSAGGVAALSLVAFGLLRRRK